MGKKIISLFLIALMACSHVMPLIAEGGAHFDLKFDHQYLYVDGGTKTVAFDLAGRGGTIGAMTWELFDESGNPLSSSCYTTSTSTDAVNLGYPNLGDVITLNGTQIAEEMGVSSTDYQGVPFTLKLTEAGNMSTERMLYLFSDSAEYHTSSSGDAEIMPGDRFNVSRVIDVKYRDKDHPEGDNTSVMVDSYEFSNQLLPDGTPADFDLLTADMQSDCIRFTAAGLGSVRIDFFYEGLDGEKKSFVVDVSVISEKYELRFLNKNSSNVLLKNDELYGSAELVHIETVIDDQGEYCVYETPVDFTLSASAQSSYGAYVSVNGHEYTVFSGNHNEEIQVTFTAASDDVEITERHIFFASDQFYLNEFEGINLDAELDEVVDLSQWIKLTYHYNDSNLLPVVEDVTSEAAWTFDFGGVFEVVGNNHGIPVVKRVSPDLVHVFWQAEINGETLGSNCWVNELHMDESLGWEFNEEYFFVTDNDYYLKLNSETRKEIRIHVLAAGEPVETGYVIDQNPDGKVIGVHLDGTVLKSLINADFDNASVKVIAETDNCLSEMDVELKNIYARVGGYDDADEFIGSGVFIPKVVDVFVQDEAHPSEELMNANVTSVSVTGDSNSYELIEVEDGWHIEYKDFGSMDILIMTDYSLTGDEMLTHSFHVNVVKERWGFWLNADQTILVPSESRTIQVDAVHLKYDEESGSVIEVDTSNLELDWKTPEIEGVSYEKSGNSLIVSTDKNAELGDLLISVDLMSGDEVVSTASTMLFVVSDYTYIVPKVIENPGLKQSVTFTPKLIHTYLDDQNQAHTETYDAEDGVYFKVYCSEQLHANGQAVDFEDEPLAAGTEYTLTRNTLNSIEIMMEAYWYNDGEYEFSQNDDIHLDSIDVEITLPKQVYFMEIGTTLKIDPEYSDESIKELLEVNWVCSNSEIASISEDGTVTAHKAGIVSITMNEKDSDDELLYLELVVLDLETKDEEEQLMTKQITHLIDALVDQKPYEEFYDGDVDELVNKIDEGKEISVNVKSASRSEHAELKHHIEDQFGDGKDIYYLDVVVEVSVENQVIGHFTQLTDKTKVTVELPDGFSSSEGTLHVYRIHKGEIERVESVDHHDGTISFMSDRFSPYALTYASAGAETVRIKGKDRFATSLEIADALKSRLGINQFDAVIFVDGRNFADALAGSYLAAEKNAPIMMIDKNNESKLEAVKEYLNENLKADGTVYILGGEAAVPEFAEETGFNTIRLKGKNRYGTNLEILSSAGVNAEEILVANGKNFADSLSASATGKPLLLVGNSLNADQKAFLAEHPNCTFTILGGTGAVSAEVEAQLSAYGTVYRVYGKTRYETSVEIAKRYFPDADAAVLAYAKNFPDGLAGGPLAYSLHAPLILSATGNTKASDYIQSKGIVLGVVLGGDSLIDDETVKSAFGSVPYIWNDNTNVIY